MPNPTARKSALRWRLLGLLLLGLFLGYAGQIASLALWFPPTHFASLWIPGGLLLAVLLLRPREEWASVIVGVIVGGALALMTRQAPAHLAISLYALMCSAIAVVAAALGPAATPMFNSLGGVARYFILAVVVLPVFNGGASALFATWSGLRSGTLEMWLVLAPAQSMSYLLLTPLVLSVIGYWQPLKRGLNSSARAIEGVLLGIGLLLLSWGIWAVAPSTTGLLPLLLFSPIPIVLLVAIRFGQLGASLSMLVVAVFAAWLGIYSNGPFSIADGRFNVHTLQMWLLAVGFIVYSLSAQSNQHRFIREQLAASHQRSHVLAGRLFNSHEEERARIARELHDGVSQQIASVGITLSSLKRAGPSQISLGLAELHHSVTTLAEDVRRISHNLHPAILEHIGLVNGLKALVEEESKHWSGEIWVNCNPDGEPFGHVARLSLYRIAQEALQNATRHSQASNIWLMLRRENAECVLEVMDDGVGFELEAKNSEGCLGLLSMEERALLVGGSFSIRSASEQGTSISARVPC